MWFFFFKIKIGTKLQCFSTPEALTIRVQACCFQEQVEVGSLISPIMWKWNKMQLFDFISAVSTSFKNKRILFTFVSELSSVNAHTFFLVTSFKSNQIIDSQAASLENREWCRFRPLLHALRRFEISRSKICH